MEAEEIERIYGEKIFTEVEFKDWKSPENTSYENTVGIVKAEASDSSPAFKFGFVGKTPEWIFKNIIDNTNSVHKKINVGTVQSNHKEDHIDWQDKKTGFSYMDFNASTNTFIVALTVWYAFYIETGYSYREMQKFFAEQMKYHFNIVPDNITMLSHIMDEKVRSYKPDKTKVLTEMEKLRQELNTVTDKLNKLSNKYNK